MAGRISTDRRLTNQTISSCATGAFVDGSDSIRSFADDLAVEFDRYARRVNFEELEQSGDVQALGNGTRLRRSEQLELFLFQQFPSRAFDTLFRCSLYSIVTTSSAT